MFIPFFSFSEHDVEYCYQFSHAGGGFDIMMMSMSGAGPVNGAYTDRLMERHRLSTIQARRAAPRILGVNARTHALWQKQAALWRNRTRFTRLAKNVRIYSAARRARWRELSAARRTRLAGHSVTRQVKLITGKGVTGASRGVVRNIGESAKSWLGKDYRVITNKAGDRIFMSKDGLRKMRFDINNSHGDLPHIHIEVFKNGRWRDAIHGTHRIYPK